MRRPLQCLFAAGMLDKSLNSITPISRLAALMRDGKDLRPVERIFFVHDGVGEAIEVIEAQTLFASASGWIE